MDALFHIDKQHSVSLQDQLFELIANRVLDGLLQPGTAMPSTRVMASMLNISRNTVIITYEKLTAEGFLTAEKRKGYFVTDEGLHSKNIQVTLSHQKQSKNLHWHFNKTYSDLPQFIKPKNWRSFTFPFIAGQVDHRLFPNREWQECCRIANNTSMLTQWLDDCPDQDDESLVKIIIKRVLPKRGIYCRPEEILITQGSQQSLYLIANILFNKETRIGIENPGYLDAANIFRAHSASLIPVSFSPDITDTLSELKPLDYLYVTPSHQCPTTITMPISHRSGLLKQCFKHNTIIIEDDYECELNFNHQPAPALKAMAPNDPIIYMGSFSKTIAPGLRLGFLVAPEPFIKEARILRKMMNRHTSGLIQKATALFISRGYYDSHIKRLIQHYHERYKTFTNTLSSFDQLPFTYSEPTGGSAVWITFKNPIKAADVLTACQKENLYFELGHFFYHSCKPNPHTARLGLSTLNESEIKDGLQLLIKTVLALK